MRSPYQEGTKSSESSGAYSIRARLTHGSNQATSTNRAPCRYAASASARVIGSLPGSEPTETIWPGCTLAPRRTASSARRWIRSAVIAREPTGAASAGAGLPRALDRGGDAARPRLAVAGQQDVGPRVHQRLQRRQREVGVGG